MALERDDDGNLIKSEIPRDAPSVCIEDFCGYSMPGHYPITFSADYYPVQRIVRFIGAWWNVPDMPSKSEPTESEVNAWVKLHIGLEWIEA